MTKKKGYRRDWWEVKLLLVGYRFPVLGFRYPTRTAHVIA